MKTGLLLKAVLMLVVACIVAGSCKSDSLDDSELSSDCYISNVQLGQMKRKVVYGDNDSIGYVSFSAASFQMTINQRDSSITNITPLPYGTQLHAVLVSVGHSGALVYRLPGDDEDRVYSSKDSIDCTGPVIFTVYASDGKSKRSYTMTLNVEKEDGSKLAWTADAEASTMYADTLRKVVACADGALVMLGCTKDGVMSCYRRSNTDKAWSTHVVQYTDGANGIADLDLQTLTLSPGKDKLLMSTKDGSQLLESNDGETWTNIEGAAGMHLLGASNARIYAVAEGIIYSKAEGEDWQQETTDADKTFTPMYNVSLLRFEQESGYTRLVMVGYNSAEATDTIPAIVWSKAWRTNEKAEINQKLEAEAKWMSYPHEKINRWLLPRMQPLCVFPYVDGIVALGRKTNTEEAKSGMLYSPDYGLTWKSNAELILSDAMSTAEGTVTATVDADNHIWVVIGNDTWHGRLNRLNK